MVNKVRTVFANMGWLMISQVIASALAFIWTIIMARYLGPSEYGIFGTAVSFTALFVILCDFGVGAYIVRAISTDFEIEDKYLNNAFSLELFLSLFYFIVVLLGILLVGWNNYIMIICLLFAFESIIKNFIAVLSLSFQAHEQMKYVAISNIILNVSTFILIILVTFTDFGLLGIAFSYIFANALSLIYVLLIIRKHFVKLKFIFNPSFYKILILGGLPFAIGSIFYSIYYSIDIVMITQFVGTYETGLYNAAYKLISVLTLFYAVYSSAIYPVMAKLFKDSKDILTLSFVKSIKYLLLVTVPISVFTCFYSYDIIAIYGSEFIEAGGVLNILIWTVCFLFINGAASMVLNASHKEISVTKIFAFAALFNVVFNLFLIPKYSIYGASVATVLSEILILILAFHVLKKINQLPNRQFVYDIAKICISSGVLAIALYFLNLNMWLAIPVSLIVYFAAIFLLKTPDEDDKLILKQILNR